MVVRGRRELVRGGAGVSKALVSRILREALGCVELIESLEVEDLSLLRSVVRRHGGAAFSVQPVGVELVDGLLRRFFRVREPVSPQWHSMCERIAEGLWDDPWSRHRLRRLWRRLCEDEA